MTSWISHLKNFYYKNKKMNPLYSFKNAMRDARPTYTRSSKKSRTKKSKKNKTRRNR